MGARWILCLVLALSAVVNVCADGQDGAFDIRHHLATKSPYWSQRAGSRELDGDDQMRLVQVNLVARHGSRDPTAGDIDALNALAKTCAKNADFISNPSFQWMKHWKNPIPTRNAGLLVSTGEMEHYKLALRMKQRAQPTLSLPYFPYTYQFQSTQVSRTGQSASSFVYGLLQGTGDLPGEYNPPFIFTESMNQDTDLRFFDNCPLYEASKVKSDGEFDSWKASVYKSVGQHIASLIGSSPDWVPNADETYTMWKACGFEVSIADDESHFCSLFSAQDALNMEYGDDLKNYWEKSYGHEINYAIACRLLNSVVSSMGDAIAATNTSASDVSIPLLGNFRFAHAETVIPFVTLLGLFKDPYPLLANSTLRQIQERQWRTSVISPFAGNVALFLYARDHRYMVKVEVNEVPYHIPGCAEVYCDFDEFRAVFAEALVCPFCAMCFPVGEEDPCVCNR